ncbi:MAG: type II toxin-antitoxin system RelE/ParE family toxin [Sulfuricella sp.]|nr:type II toxin-antitoxin system RelE/ParE family toxin [Sulfuricella sp.]
MSRIRYTNSAETDLLELWLTIAEDNLVAADESLDSIQSTVSLLATQPEMGRVRRNWRMGCETFRLVRRTSFSMCQMKMGY